MPETKTLEKVEESIKICEDIQKTDPEYYKEHWTDIHDSLINVKEDLESNGEQK